MACGHCGRQDCGCLGGPLEKGGGCALVLALPIGAVVAALVMLHEAGWA